MARIGDSIFEAIDCLNRGEIIGFPTETVYGLAGNAYDPEVVIKIFSAKKRPSFDPLIVHSNSIVKVQEFIDYFPSKAIEFASKNWPGPVTLILPKKDIIPDLVTSGLNTVAVRIPHHPLALAVLESIDFPLAAPSANPFGYISPTSANHVNDQLGTELSYILDGGQAKIGVESTIIDFSRNGIPEVVRLGGMTLEEIQDQLSDVSIKLTQNSNPTGPGMLDNHYSPKTSLELGDISDLLEQHQGKKVGLICWDQLVKGVPTQNQYILTHNQSLAEAAHNLFSALRELDNRDLDVIITSRVPDDGLGRAINDRLLRASNKSFSKL